MSDAPALLEMADYVLLGAGTALILAGLTIVSVRRRWAEVLRLPSPPAHQLEAADVLLTVLCVFFLPTMVDQLLAMVGGSPTPNPAATTQPAAPSLHQIVAVTIGQGLAIAALLAIGTKSFDGGTRGWGLALDRLPRRISQALVGYLVAAPVCFVLLEASTWLLDRLGMPTERHASIMTLLDASTPRLSRSLTILNALALAAIVEELLFRGILQPALAKWTKNPWASILICSAAFGLIHWPYKDTILPLAAFGVILGYLYARSGSLLLTILVHAVFNGKTLLWLVLGARP